MVIDVQAAELYQPCFIANIGTCCDASSRFSNGCSVADLRNDNPVLASLLFERIEELRRLVQLNEGAAGIREHCDADRPRLRRFAGEHDTARPQSHVLILNVLNLKGSKGDTLCEHRLLKCFSSGICIGLKCKLELLWTFGRDDGEPFVRANRKKSCFFRNPSTSV